MEKIFARTKGMIPMVIFLTLSGSIRATINEYITKFISLDFISCHCSMALLPHILVRRKLNLKLTLSWDIVYIALAIKLVHMRVYQYQKCSFIIFVKSKFCVCKFCKFCIVIGSQFVHTCNEYIQIYLLSNTPLSKTLILRKGRIFLSLRLVDP